MDISYPNVRYVTSSFNDQVGGCGGGILSAVSDGVERPIGRITFWDSIGQFFIELDTVEVPLEVIEKFILEVKEQNPTE